MSQPSTSHDPMLLRQPFHATVSTEDVAGTTPPNDAWLDPLTQLVSRRVFDYELVRRFEEWERRRLPVSLVIPVLKNLSRIEAMFGLAATNQLFREVARLVSAEVRKMDLPCYQPRGEFPIILPDTSLFGAGKAAERVCAALGSTEYSVLGPQQPLEYGVGVACVKPFDDPASLVRRAQDAVGAAISCDQPCVRIHNGEAIVARIEEQTQLDRQLAHARRMETVGTLAAGVAHEINTPIQYVGDNLSFLEGAFIDVMALLQLHRQLLAQCPAGAPSVELVQAIQKNADAVDVEFLRKEIPRAIEHSLEGTRRVAEIVRSMKEFAHPHVRAKTASDLNKIIESMVLVTAHEWKYAAEVVTDLDPELPLVSVLPGEVGQVIVNLIVNAAQAIVDQNGRSGEQGKIAISTQCDGEWAEIRVADTGPGLSEENRTRIFAPFFTTKPVGVGTGQGLAIARTTIVDLHGGTIDVESEPGNGACFFIRLPIGDTEAAMESPEQ